MRAILLALCLSFLPFAAALAGPDEGLYDPAPPKGSAFVRLFNLSEDAAPFTLGGVERVTAGPAELSPYFVQPKGAFEAGAGALSLKSEAEEGAFYTAFVKDGALVVLKDPALSTRAKALVAFYNLTTTPGLALKTADGKAEVVPALDPGAVSGREVNGVKVAFGVFVGAEAEAKAVLPDQVLERGKAYAAVATSGKDGKIVLNWFEARTDTTK